MRKLSLTVALGLLSLAAASATCAEIMLGVTGGVAIPGNQDLTFNEWPQGGGNPAPGGVVTQNRVDESLGALGGFTLTAWGNWSVLRYLALQFEPIYWYMQAKGAPSPPAPRFTVHEQRLAILFTGLVRLPVYPDLGRFSQSRRDTFAYAGMGVGPLYSSVSHGADDWDFAYQFLGGISVPLVSNLRLRLEARWLFVSDVDTFPRHGPGWRVDVSGNQGPKPFGRHHDTQFYPVLVGLDWTF